jgi:WD40 repeat protein
MLVGASHYGEVYRWDAATGDQIGPRLYGHGSVKCVIVATVDGSAMIVSGGDDDMVRRWDALTGNPIGDPLGPHDAWVTSVAVIPIPDGRVVIAAGAGRQIRCWDARTGEPFGPPIVVPAEDFAAVTGVADGSPAHITTVGDDGLIRVYDILTGTQVSVSDNGPPRATAVQPDGTRITAHATDDGSVAVRCEPRERS